MYSISTITSAIFGSSILGPILRIQNGAGNYGYGGYGGWGGWVWGGWWWAWAVILFIFFVIIFAGAGSYRRGRRATMPINSSGSQGSDYYAETGSAFGWFWLVIAILILIAFFGGGHWWWGAA